MHVTHDEQELTLRIRQMRWEAEGVLSLELEQPDGAPLPAWAPGAHLDLHLPGGLVRQYSLCGSPEDPSRWRIAVLHVQDSRGGSQAVHTSLRPGDVVDVVGPRNNFALVEAASYIFLAGGIGITPLVPMMAAAEERGSDWRLVYGGRSAGSMAFVAELTQRYGDRVLVLPQDEHGLLDLETILKDPRPDELVYCCGPEPLLNAVETLCSDSRPAGALHVERFAAKPAALRNDGEESEFEVVLDRSGQTFTVSPGQSVLEALEAAGIEPPSSCREGICGTCETAVLAGIPDHRDSLLSDEERAANDTMMICVGRSLSPRLVLDL
jgi:ferredoxin-NADP reductase